MLKVENDEVQIVGYQLDLIKEFALLIQSFVEKRIIDRGMMHEMIDMFGISSRDILKQSLIDEIDKMDNIGDAFILLKKLENDRRFK